MWMSVRSSYECQLHAAPMNITLSLLTQSLCTYFFRCLVHNGERCCAPTSGCHLSTLLLSRCDNQNEKTPYVRLVVCTRASCWCRPHTAVNTHTGLKKETHDFHCSFKTAASVRSRFIRSTPCSDSSVRCFHLHQWAAVTWITVSRQSTCDLEWPLKLVDTTTYGKNSTFKYVAFY